VRGQAGGRPVPAPSAVCEAQPALWHGFAKLTTLVCCPLPELNYATAAPFSSGQPPSPSSPVQEFMVRNTYIYAPHPSMRIIGG
jgi:hypothetical protein